MRELKEYVGERSMCRSSSTNSAEREFASSKIDIKTYSTQSALSREFYQHICAAYNILSYALKRVYCVAEH